jgi:hypothetical protein
MVKHSDCLIRLSSHLQLLLLQLLTPMNAMAHLRFTRYGITPKSDICRWLAKQCDPWHLDSFNLIGQRGYLVLSVYDSPSLVFVSPQLLVRITSSDFHAPPAVH